MLLDLLILGSNFKEDKNKCLKKLIHIKTKLTESYFKFTLMILEETSVSCLFGILLHMLIGTCY